MKDLTCIQSILIFLHFLRNTLDFPLFFLTQGAEIAFAFPERTVGRKKPKPRASLLREPFFFLAYSEHLKISPAILLIVLTLFCQFTRNDSFSFNKQRQKNPYSIFLPRLPCLGWVEEEGYSFSNSPPPCGAAGRLPEFQKP